MNYIDEASKILAKKTNANLTKFLSNFNLNYLSTAPYLTLTNCLGYIHGTNALMDFYMNSADPNTQEQMDNDFHNFFKNNSNKYLSLSIANYPNLEVTFDTGNPAYQIFPEEISLNYSYQEASSFTIFNFKIKHNSGYASDIVSKNIKSLNDHFDKLFSSKKGKEFVFTTFISNQTLKLRDLILRHHQYYDESSKNFMIKIPSHYSHLFIQKLGSMTYSFIDTPDQSFNEVQNLLEDMKFFDNKYVNKLIKELSTWDSSSGNFKDLDEFNQAKLSIFTDYFTAKFDLIDPENLPLLRITRNIAKSKGIELNYVDERVTVNSVTDEKIVLFGDKVGCEIVIIDTKILLSRFPSSINLYNVADPISALFNFAKKERIFKNIVITPGKRSYKHILTVFCQKDKNHSEEELINLSDTFSEAIFLYSQADRFDDVLEKIHRERKLKKEMEKAEKVITTNSKQKI